MTHLHIIGICGTAMAGLAIMAKELGLQVTGSDSGIYPPMSTLLASLAIPMQEGFSPANLQPRPDLVLVGNTISRGNSELEAVLDQGIPYRSGAQWLFEQVLEGRHPVVATGTHGKTTTTSLLARIWEEAGWQPGFLIGGMPLDFGRGARLPTGPWVVVEGDEYDTAFFDKRPKFLHYRPRTLLINNLEFDHADIYPDLESIRRQFRLLLRSVPASGHVIANGDDPEVEALLSLSFGRVVRYGITTRQPFMAKLESPDGRRWGLYREDVLLFSVTWSLLGQHNVANGLAAATAALVNGMAPEQVKAGLEGFQGVARRLQRRFEVNQIAVYDDFAHHPTAIATTLAGLRAAIGPARLWVIVEPRSNTMRTRVHQDRLAPAFACADRVILARPQARGLTSDALLDVEAVVAQLNDDQPPAQPAKATVVANADEAVQLLGREARPGDHMVIMSNGGFDDIHQKLKQELTPI
ncbi:MAG: UDP-N-acetylmuramate:L-alanyl-gamma-D-glutamyl-meso-diaminopimelate ligase [Magnetococcales bacterium]|nr:UDP-N-acetylmuramate:L-alanyl-gamma-D-glutamyl-meso-diaminopimelate ligase [Magnetococcales bacterium]